MKFETKVKVRTIASIIIALAGLYLLYFVSHNALLGANDYLSGFYTGTGLGLIGAGVVTFIKNLMYLINPERFKKAKIEDTDERNLYLWVRSGHRTLITTIMVLFISLLFTGVTNAVAFSTTLNILALISFVYLVNYIILKKMN